jgi:site-specific DNA-methyltransferase (adenine-specific)
MINSHNVDCMNFMRGLPDKAYDLAICDPEYGIGEDGGRDRGNSVRQKNGTVLRVRHVGYEKKGWDKTRVSADCINEICRVSKNQILFGANHYSDLLPKPSSAWVIWDKVNGANDFADVEMAWTSFDSAARLFAFMWSGMHQGSPENGRRQQGNKKLNEKRIHPTQKPVALYRWLLQNYAKPGWKILDTHGGSFSHAIACDIEGYDLDICELDKDYFEAGKKRFEDHLSQPRIFTPEPIEQPIQLSLISNAQ